MENKEIETPLDEANPQAHLVWATKKRHIAVAGKILCSQNHGCGFSAKNGQYNSFSLAGLPTNILSHDDGKYSHSHGVIEFKPLEEQRVKIITTSICKKCMIKYKKLLTL